MLLGTLGFVLMVAFVKLVREEMGTLEVMSWRGVFALPIAWFFVRGKRLRLERKRLFALRCALGLSGMTCAYAAARELAVADLSLIWRMQPLFVALIAPIALGARERGSRRVFVAMAGGLLGCAVLLGPDMEGGPIGWGLVALLGAAFAGGAHVCIRRLNASEHPAALVFWFQVAIVGISAVATGIAGGVPFALPGWHVLPALAGAGIAGTAGQLLMTHAYAHDKATTVAVAGYMGPLWAVLVDIVAFGLVPGWEVLVGGLVILAASSALLFDPDDEVPAAEGARQAAKPTASSGPSSTDT